MNEDEFRVWLESKGMDRGGVSSRLSSVKRVEQVLDDLEDLAMTQTREAFLQPFTYRSEDKRLGKPNPSPLSFSETADLYNGLSSIRTALGHFHDFVHQGGPDDGKIGMAQIEDAMDAYDQYRATEVHSEIFDAFGDPRDYWVRSTRQREKRVYPTKPLVGFILNKTKLNGGWGQKADAAARLHNAGFIIVDQNDQPIEPPERYKHLIEGADRIRLCALNYFIEPAREKVARQVSIRAGDLAAAMGLKDLFSEICQALGGEEFQKLAQVPPPTSSDPNPSSSTVFTYTLNSQPEEDTAMKTLNTILYGPPGTGKTYATFRKAVEICDGAEAVAAMDGKALKTRYAELRDAGRIGFVTFHQSYSYEEFVEGLRPEGDVEDAGFTLQPKDGALREIAALAVSAPDRVQDPRSVSDLKGQRFWKMSLGFSNGPDAKEIFEDCLQTGRIVMGYGHDVDWSDEEYSSRPAILERLNRDHPDDGKNKSHASFVDHFRNELKIGDYVIVPDGNLKFKAIGKVTGPYEYLDREEGFAQARPVQWLWHGKSLPVSQIKTGNFTMRTLYVLPPDTLKHEAIAGFIEPDVGRSKQPFVLVIDEINRANISKVFGELITLLEEDKREGAENEVAVRLPYSGDSFTLPANLHFLGTMNTADRSIALLDTALRRRFHFEEMPPRPDLLVWKGGLDLSELLKRLNARIEYLLDRDHLIGHAFFMGCETRADIDTVMRRKVLPLLAEYFHEDWERIVAVLGGSAQGFIAKERLDSPPGLDLGMEDTRHRYTVRSAFPHDAYAGLQA